MPRTSRPSSDRMTTMTFEPPPSAHKMSCGLSLLGWAVGGGGEGMRWDMLREMERRLFARGSIDMRTRRSVNLTLSRLAVSLSLAGGDGAVLGETQRQRQNTARLPTPIFPRRLDGAFFCALRYFLYFHGGVLFLPRLWCGVNPPCGDGCALGGFQAALYAARC